MSKKINLKLFFQKTDVSLGIIALCTIIFLAIIYSLIQITDLDIWLHLKAGEYIVKNLSVFQADPFSFTLNHKPWIDHSWLFQAIAYSIKNISGFNGLLGLQAALMSLSFVLFFLTVYRQKENLLLIAVFGLTLLLITRGRFTVRPDIFSILFFSYYCFVLFRKRKSKLIYSLIPAQLFWVNLHGYNFLGLFLIAVFFVDDIIRRKKRLSERLNDVEFQRLQIVFFSSIAACLFNPYAYKGLIYPCSVLIEKFFSGNVFISKVQELQPALRLSDLFDFNSKPVYKLLILSSSLSFFLNLKHFRIRNFILWLALLIASLSAIRNIVYFGFIACVLAVDNVSAYLKENAQLYLKSDNLRFILKFVGYIILIIFAISQAKNFMSEKYFSFENKGFKKVILGVSDKVYPKKAVDFILENDLPQMLFNDFNSGAYLIGRCFPKRSVFIDGRTELYGSQFLNDYNKIISADSAKIEEAVEKYDLQGFLCSFGFSESSKDLLKYLSENENWKIIYLDDSAVIFLKDNKENERLIKKFSIDFDNWKAPDFDYEQYGSEKIVPYPYIGRSKIFDYLGFPDPQIKEAASALNILPSSSIAYNSRGNAFFEKKMYEEAGRDFRNASIINPADADYRNNLGSAYLEKGEVELAIKEFQEAIKIDKRLSSAYYNLSIAYKRLDKEDEVLNNLRMAAKFSPENNKYTEKLANHFYFQHDIANAIKYYEKALKISDHNARLLVSYGVCLGAVGEHQKASEEFIKAIKIDADYVNAYLNLGNSYMNLGKPQEALRAFRKVLRIDPKNKAAPARIRNIRLQVEAR